MTRVLFAVILFWFYSVNAVNNTCCYKFQSPEYPSFVLTPPQPNSPGDVTLNPNNPIIQSNDQPLNPGQGCNGDYLEYLTPNGNWTSYYYDCYGNLKTTIDLFYATAQDKVNLRTVQIWQSNISSILTNTTLRLWITCDNNIYSCIQFEINGTSSNTIDANGNCFNNEGVRIVGMLWMLLGFFWVVIVQ